MTVLGRKACLLPVCRESESGGSISRLSKKLHLFPRKWAGHRYQALLVCGQWAGMQLSPNNYLCCCSCTQALQCTPQCAVLCTALCVRQPLFAAGKQCFVHGGAHLHCVHGARSRPAVGSRLAEGSGVQRLCCGRPVSRL